MKTFAATAFASLLLAAPAPAQDADIGAELYAQSCAGCHGEKADGKGPVADVFKIEVPALTDLAARNDGAFPMLQVIHIIDGRTGLRGHEGVMPVFGTLFTEEQAYRGDYGAVLEARGRIMSIALYLESIQQ